MKILLVDDHSLIRDALRGVVTELKNDAVILEASTFREALRLVGEYPDLGLILLDLNLPDRDGFELLPELRRRHPAISVVVLSAFDDRASVIKALGLGALGFIPKSAQREVMVSALRLIFSGGKYIPPEIFARDERDGARLAQGPPRSPSDLGLTERQIEVLALMMDGKSNKMICRALDLAESTVKNHVTSILRALKVTNRTAAVIAAADLKWDFLRGSAP